ncbi:MAG TPA: aminotransferase class V-fold PLP-dependent enzyme [Dehalococcoidia bacterium]|nr:aminotransferase class V-fold PLP-dependent enzyme [Dehalococcoidia bacterium]
MNAHDGRIYLDHAATTPPDPRVIEAMLPYLTTAWGNPSSIYAEAQEARRGLDAARRTVAAVLNAKPNEIVFTSGGTEADNLAIRGVAEAQRARGRDHIITTAIEHHAVLHVCDELAKDGFRITHVPVDGEGFADIESLRAAIDDHTALVSVMYANNEVGTVQPIAEIARAVKERDAAVAVHTDAVQAAGALPLDVEALGVDLLSIAAHKIYGPKGVGALYLRGRVPFRPQTVGGSQERNRRAGTENVAGAAGLAVALRIAQDEMVQTNELLVSMRDRLLDEIPRRVPGTIVTGARDRRRRLPNNASFAFKHLEGEAVLLQLDLQGIAASSGSACTTASLEPSHVLVAMGVPEEYLRGSLRLTLGRDNTPEHVERVLAALPDAVARIRSLAPAG